MKQTPKKYIVLILFFALGVTLACSTLFPKTQKEQSAPPVLPEKITKDYVPDTSNLTPDKIQLPEMSAIPQDQQQALVELMIKSDIAEILAIYYQDDSYIKPYAAGSELRRNQDWIKDLQQSGQIVLPNIDLNRSYYVNLYLKSNVLYVDACEYWQNYYYDSNGNLTEKTEWELEPQTMSFETIDNKLYLTAVSFYTNNAFCTH